MKKIVATITLLVLAFTLVGCGEGTGSKNKFVPDIKIEDIEWSVGSGMVEGKNYVLLEFTNNSQYVIASFELEFTEKSKVSKEDKDTFYDDIQKSQGLDDEYMQGFIESKELLNQPITMCGKCEEEVGVGLTSSKVKCYYYGGWSSRDVLHSDLLTPKIATIEYIKDDIKHTLYYNFESEMYDIEAE